MALDACAGEEKPLHAHSASGSGELRLGDWAGLGLGWDWAPRLRWLEPGPRRGGSDFAERTLSVRYSYDVSNIAAVRYELSHTLFF